MIRACVSYISNKFHVRYKRIEYTLNAFGARFRHASLRYMSILILRNIAAVTYPKCVRDACLTFDACL